uniref:(California timema) hypothetical protein n=1 Tax=Timema californicum TaxID=61474 RepID=A0A7R9JEY6_TIMCA|nr:unnamed protein product [Timema californicum]
MTDFGGEGLSDKSSARVLQVYVSNNLTWDEGSQGTVNYTTHIGKWVFPVSSLQCHDPFPTPYVVMGLYLVTHTWRQFSGSTKQVETEVEHDLA